VVTNFSRALSLQDALKEDKYALMGSIADVSLSANDQKTLSTARTLFSTGNIDRLSSLQGDSERLLRRLSDAAKNAHVELTRAERNVITEMTLESLTTLGYQTKSKLRGTDILVRGGKKDLSIVAHINTNNELHIDMAGFEGGACKAELARLNEELTRRGIGMEIKSSIHHGKKDGGILAQDIAKELPIEFNPLIESAAKVAKAANAVQHMRKMSNLLGKVRR
jgi:hypothetical protein